MEDLEARLRAIEMLLSHLLAFQPPEDLDTLDRVVVGSQERSANHQLLQHYGRLVEEATTLQVEYGLRPPRGS